LSERRSYFHVKLGAAQRYLMWHIFPDQFQHVRVTEFPKSGGTWLCQLLSEVLELPFPRNKMMTWKKGIQHSHYPGPVRNQKTILMVRDGRDVIVSAYYHFIIGHKGDAEFITEKWRKQLNVPDPEYIEKHLPKFIDLFFSNYKVGGRQMDWTKYLQSFDLDNPNLSFVRYENLLTQPQMEIRRLIDWLGHSKIEDNKIKAAIQKYAFKNRTGRNPGEESTSSFLRKGVAGDWRNKFNQEATQIFMSLEDKQLERFNYSL